MTNHVVHVIKRRPWNAECLLAYRRKGFVLRDDDAIGKLLELCQSKQRVVVLYDDLAAFERPDTVA